MVPLSVSTDLSSVQSDSITDALTVDPAVVADELHGGCACDIVVDEASMLSRSFSLVVSSEFPCPRCDTSFRCFLPPEQTDGSFQKALMPLSSHSSSVHPVPGALLGFGVLRTSDCHPPCDGAMQWWLSHFRLVSVDHSQEAMIGTWVVLECSSIGASPSVR